MTLFNKLWGKENYLPSYNKRGNFNTNAESYYKYLERVNEVLKIMAKKIDEYDGTLQEYLLQWDKNLEDFPDDVKDLLEEWLVDGTLEHIINHEIFNDKLDKTIFEQFELSTNQQLVQIQVDVLTFGAVGDGITDDTLSIQKALNSMVDGGTLYFPKNKTFVISSPLLVPKNVSLRGYYSTIESAIGIETPFQMIKMSVNDKHIMSRVEGLTINQKRLENGFLDDQVNSAVIPRNNVIFENCHILNTISSGIASSNGVENITIKNCVIEETGHHPIYFSTDDSFFVRNIIIKNNILGTPATIAGRVHTGCLLKFRHGKSGDIVENIIIEENTFGICTDNSISVYFNSSGSGTSIFKNIKIKNNTFNYLNENTGIISSTVYFGANSTGENIEISENEIIGNTLSENNTSYGIRLLFNVINNSAILKNNIVDGFTNAINMVQGIIKNNVLLFSDTGIFLVQGGSIEDNTLSSNKDNAKGVYRTNAHITNNVIILTGVNTVGIELRELTNKIVSSNNVNASEPIKRTSGGTIANNDFNNNHGTEPIYVGFNESTLIENVFDSGKKLKLSYNNIKPSDAEIGTVVFDVQLNKPIYYTGTIWVDSTGTPI